MCIYISMCMYRVGLSTRQTVLQGHLSFISHRFISFLCVQDSPPSHGWTGLHLSVESHICWWTGRCCCCSGHVPAGGGRNQADHSKLQAAHIHRRGSLLVKDLQERGAARPLQGIFPHCLGFVYTLLQTNSFLVDRVIFCIWISCHETPPLPLVSCPYRCNSLFCRMLCSLHELGQAVAGASCSLHSPAELNKRLFGSRSGSNPLVPFWNCKAENASKFTEHLFCLWGMFGELKQDYFLFFQAGSN